MNIFERYMYGILGKDCLPAEKCPGIQAERAGKDAQEICVICAQCWNRINQKQK